MMNFLGLLLILILPCTATAAPITNPIIESRVALVIGNASYPNGALKNPVNDVRSVAKALERVGFKVILKENQTREEMHQSIGQFSKNLREGGVGLFYYAGHGMQINGQNFLIPVDADIQHEDDVEFRSLDANYVLTRMNAANNRVNLVILDACRNNPFKRASRSGNLGLAQMDAPRGTLIAFSTAPGSLAKDGHGPNSIYANQLVKRIDTPAIRVEQIFKEVRIAVAQETANQQIPWESSSLMGDFYFVPPSTDINSSIASNEYTSKQRSTPSTSKNQGASKSIPDNKADIEQSSATPATKNKHNSSKPDNKTHHLNREGYEIEIRAKNLTADELPALQKSAEAGDVIAQTTLGWAYLLGKGALDGRNINRSNSLMLKWTQKAAQQGYAVAQNNLGAMYQDGVGVPVDYQKAYKYFKLSADQGYLTAKANAIALAPLVGKSDPNLWNNILNNLQTQMNEAKE